MPYQSNVTGTIAEIMGRQAQIEAERQDRIAAAQARAGEIGAQAWGGAAQNIAQNVRGSLADVVQQRRQATLDAQNAETRGLQNTAARQQIAQGDQAVADRGALDTAFGQGVDRDSILNSLPGHLRPAVEKQFRDADEAALKVKDLRNKVNEAEQDYFGRLASAVKQNNYAPTAAAAALQHAKEQGHDVTGLQQQLAANPDQLKNLVDGLIASSPEQVRLARESAAQAETSRHNLETEAAAKSTAATNNEHFAATLAESVRNHKAMEARPVAGAPNGQPDDVKLTIEGMKAGTLPPQLPGRASKEYIALMAEAKRQGYDLAGAATDWMATQKHIATLNGAQQLRLNQSINSLPDMLDSVEKLAGQWKGGQFPILNKANLALAVNGVYGEQVASVANQLQAQIADVTADLGNVYMGGNSPTDHALGLAAKSLQGEWSQKVLTDMIGLARQNVQIRRNSINSTGVAGASSDNPYAPPAAQTQAPQAPAGWKYVPKPGGGWTAVQATP